jgi:general secretion pathway protein L
VHAAVTGDAPVTDLTLRLSEHAALGLPIQSESATAIAHDVLQTLEALAPEGDLALRVDAASMEIYRDALQSHPLLAQRAALTEDRWQDWIAGTKATSPNLLSALQAGMQRAIDWRAWRRPLALAACLLFVNLIALNLQWWHLKNEAQRLRTAMTEIYRSAYPAEKVIVDPLLQMQQKLATARRMTGQLAADDFVTLAAALGEAINSIAPPNNPESILASIEYRDRALLVKFKADRDISMSGIKAALAKRNLSLSKTDTAAWQIGVAK